VVVTECPSVGACSGMREEEREAWVSEVRRGTTGATFYRCQRGGEASGGGGGAPLKAGCYCH
jgi:hypothetical protein